MADILNQITSWPFLDEPLWRWFLFMGAMMGIVLAWHGVVDLMK